MDDLRSQTKESGLLRIILMALQCWTIIMGWIVTSVEHCGTDYKPRNGLNSWLDIALNKNILYSRILWKLGNNYCGLNARTKNTTIAVFCLNIRHFMAVRTQYQCNWFVCNFYRLDISRYHITRYRTLYTKLEGKTSVKLRISRNTRVPRTHERAMGVSRELLG